MSQIETIAHRISFLLHNGYLPSEDNVVMHTCDNRQCVNPSHLKEGTHSDNMQDMLSKGRGNFAKGNVNHRSKIMEEDIKDIVQKRKNGVEVKQIAQEYTISSVQVYRITTGTRRQWLTKGIL